MEAYDMEIDFTGPWTSEKLRLRVTTLEGGICFLKFQEFSKTADITTTDMISTTPLPEKIRPLANNSIVCVVFENNLPVISFAKIQADGIVKIKGNFQIGQIVGLCSQVLPYNCSVVF